MIFSPNVTHWVKTVTELTDLVELQGSNKDF